MLIEVEDLIPYNVWAAGADHLAWCVSLVVAVIILIISVRTKRWGYLPAAGINLFYVYLQVRWIVMGFENSAVVEMAFSVMEAFRTCVILSLILKLESVRKYAFFKKSVELKSEDSRSRVSKHIDKIL